MDTGNWMFAILFLLIIISMYISLHLFISFALISVILGLVTILEFNMTLGFSEPGIIVHIITWSTIICIIGVIFLIFKLNKIENLIKRKRILIAISILTTILFGTAYFNKDIQKLDRDYEKHKRTLITEEEKTTFPSLR